MTNPICTHKIMEHNDENVVCHDCDTRWEPSVSFLDQCPFCGSKKIWSQTLKDQNGDISYIISCDNCPVSMEGCIFEILMKRWNRRVSGSVLEMIKRIIERQANDKALWFLSPNSAEAHLQEELRNLHMAVEAFLQNA